MFVAFLWRHKVGYPQAAELQQKQRAIKEKKNSVNMDVLFGMPHSWFLRALDDMQHFMYPTLGSHWFCAIHMQKCKVVAEQLLSDRA